MTDRFTPTLDRRGKVSSAFVGLLNRDLRVLRRTLGQFVGEVVLQPLLLVFTFTYVLPKVGIGLSTGSTTYATLLVPGLLAATAISTGISTVTTPLSTDLGGTREIDDRVMAPITIAGVAREKILIGAVYAWISALLVLPLCELVSATPVQIHVQSWPLFIVISFLLGITAGALGLTLGTLVKPTQVGVLYGVLVIPMQFLGCVYYPWAALHNVPWVQDIVLINPLTYLSEGTRAALTPQVPHMAVWVILPVASVLALFFCLAASVLLRKRIVS